MRFYAGVFIFDSRNTGYYSQEFYQTVKMIRDWAKDFAGDHYRIEFGTKGAAPDSWEEYENGERVAWSM